MKDGRAVVDGGEPVMISCVGEGVRVDIVERTDELVVVVRDRLRAGPDPRVYPGAIVEFPVAEF